MLLETSEHRYARTVPLSEPMPAPTQSHTHPPLEIDHPASVTIQPSTSATAQQVQDDESAKLRSEATSNTAEYWSPLLSSFQRLSSQSETSVSPGQINSSPAHPRPLSLTASHRSMDSPPPKMVPEATSFASDSDEYNSRASPPIYSSISKSEARSITHEIPAQPDIRDYLMYVDNGRTKAKSHPTGIDLTHLADWSNAPDGTHMTTGTTTKICSETELIFPDTKSFWKYTSSRPGQMFNVIRRLMKHQVRLQNNCEYLRISRDEGAAELKKRKDLEGELRNQVTELQKRLDRQATIMLAQQHQFDLIDRERHRLEEVYSQLIEKSKAHVERTGRLISHPQPEHLDRYPSTNRRNGAIHRPEFQEPVRYRQDSHGVPHLPHRSRTCDIKRDLDDQIKGQANRRAITRANSNLIIPANVSGSTPTNSPSQDIAQTSGNNWL